MKMIYIDDNKSAIYIQRPKQIKVLREVEDNEYNFDKELARQSLKIAKANYNYDTRNKYYKEQLDKAQIEVDKLKQ